MDDRRMERVGRLEPELDTLSREEATLVGRSALGDADVEETAESKVDSALLWDGRVVASTLRVCRSNMAAGST